MNPADQAVSKRAVVMALLLVGCSGGGADDPTEPAQRPGTIAVAPPPMPPPVPMKPPAAMPSAPTPPPDPGQDAGAADAGLGVGDTGVGVIGVYPPPDPPQAARDLQRVRALRNARRVKPARLFDLARRDDGSVFLAAGAGPKEAILARFEKSGSHGGTAALQAVGTPATGTCAGNTPWVEIVGVLLDGRGDQGRVLVSGHYCGMLQTHRGDTSAPSQGVDAFVASYRPDGGLSWFQTLATKGRDWISRPLRVRTQGGSHSVSLVHAHGNTVQLKHVSDLGMWSQPTDSALRCAGAWRGLVAGASPDGARLGLVAHCDATPRVACLAADSMRGDSTDLRLHDKRAQDFHVRALLVADKQTAGGVSPCLVVAGDYEWENVSQGGVAIDRERGAFVRAFNTGALETWAEPWIPGDVVINDLAWWHGKLVVSGWFRGALSLQQAHRPWISAGAGDGFVAVLDVEAGTTEWSQPLAGSGGSWDLQLGNGGRALLVGGIFSRQITYDSFIQTSPDRDLFLARLPVP